MNTSFRKIKSFAISLLILNFLFVSTAFGQNMLPDYVLEAMRKEEEEVEIFPFSSLDFEEDQLSDEELSARTLDYTEDFYEITENPDDRWKYRTPSLRNIALTAPYMHDGSFSTLSQVIEFYKRGGIENDLLDPLIRPLKLSEQETDQLLAFLNALTGDNADALVADAFAIPVGNSGSEP